MEINPKDPATFVNIETQISKLPSKGKYRVFFDTEAKDAHIKETIGNKSRQLKSFSLLLLSLFSKKAKKKLFSSEVIFTSPYSMYPNSFAFDQAQALGFTKLCRIESAIVLLNEADRKFALIDASTNQAITSTKFEAAGLLVFLIQWAFNDGQYSDSEKETIKSLNAIFGFNNVILDLIELRAYQLSMDATKEDRKITKEEEQLISNMRQQLGISDESLPATKKEYSKLLLLSKVFRGEYPLPPVSRSVVLKKNERLLYGCPVIINTTTQSSKYVASMRPGISFNLGGSTRGFFSVSKPVYRKVTETQTEKGELIITDKRFLVNLRTGTTQYWLSSIVGVDLYDNGIRIKLPNVKKDVVYELSNSDFVAMILDRAIAES